MELKTRIQKRWRGYQQARALRNAQLSEVGRYPGKFDIPARRAQEMLPAAVEKIEHQESVPEQIALIYKLSVAGPALAPKQLFRLLDACIPLLKSCSWGLSPNGRVLHFNFIRLSLGRDEPVI